MPDTCSKTIFFFVSSVIKDGIFAKIDDGISTEISLEESTSAKENQAGLSSEAATSTQPTLVLKTELASLLDGSSLKKPASVNVVVLWNYTAKHPTDLNVKKGERVRILYRNGDLAFVENREQRQGFVPLCYCSLYRRRSSSFSELCTETARKLSGAEIVAQGNENGILRENRRNSLSKEMASDTSKKKRFGKLISRGTYDAKEAENKSRRKSDKGILNSAAKKIMKAFTSTLPTKAKGKSYKGVPEKRPIPDWLLQLNFDNNNPDYSSSSDSSDEDDDDSAYESFRPGSEICQPVVHYNGSDENNIGVPEYFHGHEPVDGLTIAKKLSQEYDSQEFATGYANVRKLKTSSKSSGKRVSRSRSFNLDSKTNMLHRVLQPRPKDLMDGSNSESEVHEADRMMGSNLIKRVPSHGCIPYDNFVRSQSESFMVVVQDFITNDNKDLNVVKGQRVRVLNKSDGEWWMCETEDGCGGFVPRGYLVSEQNTLATYCRDAADGNFTRGRNDWQDLSFRTKAVSVKLARITPMAREPSLQQGGEAISLARDISGDGRDSLEIHNSAVWTMEDTALKKGMYSEECNAEECYECIAACPTCLQGPIDVKSYVKCLMNCDTGLKSQVRQNCLNYGEISETDKSGTELGTEADLCKKLELKEEKLLLTLNEPKSCDMINENQSRSSIFECNETAKSGNMATNGAHIDIEGDQKDCMSENKTEIGRQLPTYAEIMEQRNFDGLSGIKSHVPLNIKALDKEFEPKNSSTPGQVEKLLEEWRSLQKQSPEMMPTLEQGISSDSQSTISDSFDSAVPRVLRRRNSMNRRVRFQTPDSLRISESKSEIETVVMKSDTNKEHILATWL